MNREETNEIKRMKTVEGKRIEPSKRNDWKTKTERYT